MCSSASRELLTERQRGGILQVRAADFDDIGPLNGLRVERVAQFLHCGQQAHERFRGGHVHRRGERVVGRLRHVDVIVGMHGLLRAHLTAGQLDRAIRDDLVDVHVGLRAGARLPHAQGEVGVEFARDDFVGRTHDQVGLFGIELAQIAVDQGRRLLERGHGLDHGAGHLVARRGAVADIEVNQRTSGLRAVIFV